MLDAAAEKMAGDKVMVRPWSLSLNSWSKDKPKDTCTKGVVFKRSVSDCSSHVIIGSDSMTLDILRRKISRDQGNPGNSAGWLAQEAVESLLKQGELRVFMGEGTVHDVIFTIPDEQGDVKVENVLGLPPLRLIECVYNNWRLTHIDHFSETTNYLENFGFGPSKHISTKIGAEGLDGLKKFCLETREELVKAEKNPLSSIRYFVRMDIGVIKRDGKHHYFVNEVTRLPDVTLYLHARGGADCMVGVVPDILLGMRACLAQKAESPYTLLA